MDEQFIRSPTEFINDCKPALNHLFEALAAYENAKCQAEVTAEQIAASENLPQKLFLDRDQFSNDANHHYATLQRRLAVLKKQIEETELSHDVRLHHALERLESTVESMASLAGAVLQISNKLSH